MELRLQYTLSLVNDWLKYAETKNAALFTGDSALILGLLALLFTVKNINQFLQIYLVFAVVMLVVSASLCLISFIAKLKLKWLATQRKPENTDNLLYYGHIASYGVQDYMVRLKEFSEDDIHTRPIDSLYVEQIITNSKIALVKFRVFNTAVFFSLSAFVTPVLAVPIFWYARR